MILRVSLHELNFNGFTCTIRKKQDNYQHQQNEKQIKVAKVNMLLDESDNLDRQTMDSSELIMINDL